MLVAMENHKMKNLIVALIIILVSASFIHAQIYDWAISSQGEPVDEGDSGILKNGMAMLNAKLMASDAANGATFGYSVAISGNTAVIGAYQHNLGTKRAQGAVYVFVRTKENVWIQQAKLVAADGSMKDYFGQCVAIDGDTIVVGVPQADIGKDKDQGAVYVFTRTGNHWAEQIKLKATGGAATDIFGNSVGISGDTIIVGAPGTDNYPNDKIRQAHGAAYIFTRGNNVWTERQKLTGDHPSSVAFGMNVAINNKTAVVGGGGEVGTTDLVYVFTNQGTGWKQETKISSPSTEDEKILNNSVSNNLAIDGNTIVVGGTQKGNKSNGGVVFVYVRENGKWTRQAKLTPSDGVKGDLFGWSVDISGDTVIVGESLVSNQFRGSTYLFNRKLTPTGYVWVEQQKLTVNDSLLGDRFGCSVGISNDSIIIGADNHDLKNRNGNEGSAYIFNYSALAAGSSTQRNSESRTRKIMLVKNARKNGYTTTQEGNTIYFQADNVEDPLTKKLIEGLKEFEYRCQSNQSPTRLNLSFSNGRSNRIKIACNVPLEPQIILLDEPSAN
jgi:energy-coupling factor transporter ATP-binding protein EcfA2